MWQGALKQVFLLFNTHIKWQIRKRAFLNSDAQLLVEEEVCLLIISHGFRSWTNYWLIDWYFTPTLVIFELYRGILNKCSLLFCLLTIFHGFRSWTNAVYYFACKQFSMVFVAEQMWSIVLLVNHFPWFS